MQINTIEYLEKTAAKFGNKTAIVDKDESISFNNLTARAKIIAHAIIENKVGPNCPVAVFLPKSVKCLICFTGILYSGNFYVPLDTKSPPERLKNILKTLEPQLILTNASLRRQLEEIGYPQGQIIVIEELPQRNAVGEKEIKERLARMIDTDPVYCIFTSGSTGIPKGVVIPHRGVIDYINWAIECFDIDHTHIIGNQAPFYFDNSTLDIYLMMATGATLVLVPEELYIFPAELLHYMEKQKINFVFWVPSVLVNIANLKLLDDIDIPHLKKVLFAGEVMPNKHLNYWRKRQPFILYANLYGPTEITVDCTYYIVEKEFLDDDSLPIGFPCRNSDVLILNENNQPTRVNENGELCVRGSSLALGYYNDLEKTNSVFTQNPLNPHYPERIYRTGDIVYRNESNEIIFVGRKDSQIKHMGYRIELGEIETAALGIHDVKNACVFYNFSQKEITLFYEAHQELDAGSLRKALGSKLPKYMIPRKLIRLNKMPINANGKIDRKTIKREYQIA